MKDFEASTPPAVPERGDHIPALIDLSVETPVEPCNSSRYPIRLESDRVRLKPQQKGDSLSDEQAHADLNGKEKVIVSGN